MGEVLSCFPVTIATAIHAFNEEDTQCPRKSDDANRGNVAQFIFIDSEWPEVKKELFEVRSQKVFARVKVIRFWVGSEVESSNQVVA